MKIALISLTENGKILANSISTAMEDDPTVIKVDTFHKNVKKGTLESIICNCCCHNDNIRQSKIFQTGFVHIGCRDNINSCD